MVFDVARLSAESASQVDQAGRAEARLQAGFWAYASRPWPGGRLPIAFDFEPTAREQEMVASACAEWSRRAAVSCRLSLTELAAARREDRLRALLARGQRPPDDGRAPLPVARARDSLVLMKSVGCWSTVGRPAGPAAMSLQDACWHRGVILHELGHAFGAMHEHQRPDAWRFIELHHENIRDEGRFAYMTLAADGHDEARATAYDFLSVMHYGPGFFSRGGPTFSLRPQYARFNGRVGRQEAVSLLDGEGLARLYGWSRAPNRCAEAEGYSLRAECDEAHPGGCYFSDATGEGLMCWRPVPPPKSCDGHGHPTRESCVALTRRECYFSDVDGDGLMCWRPGLPGSAE